MEFRLLLPDDDASAGGPRRRAGGWCNGFLYGLAVRGLRPMEELPDELREILSDFSEIGRAGVAEEEAEESGESALLELVEYVRVAVQIVTTSAASPEGAAAPALRPSCRQPVIISVTRGSRTRP
jgi:uncharacterized protein